METWQTAPFTRPGRVPAPGRTPAPADGRAAGGAGAGCADGLIALIGDPGFAEAGLATLNGALQAASWSVYQVWPQRGRAEAPLPRLHLSASHGVPDTTGECFRAYRAGLYRRDRSFEPLRRARRPGQAMVMKMSADDAPNDEHREIIYRRHGVLERLSVAHWDEADDSLLAINLYHHSHQGRFDPLEMERFSELAPLLLACVRRHIALQPRLAPTGPAESPRLALQRRCPALTERELDVCERLLRGWSYDGIAADMALGVATVKTYRARAFGRLGLHFRSELFALVAPG